MTMRVAAAFLFCSLVSANAFAQTTNATLGGTVSDSTGALIPGVTITATNTQTGIVNTAVTNEAGAYQFASLQNGRYNLRAELPGFQSQVRNDFDLGVSQQVRLNFVLQVGNVAQSVDVNVAADTLIATTSSSVGAVLPEYKVRDLPLATRNVVDLVGTTAGASSGSFAGGRMSAINVTRDGVTTSDGRYAAQMGVSTTTYVSPDLVEEVRVIVAPADAELGRGSGQVQMATRAGTNQFRGSVFWTNRNSALDANSWLNNFNGARKDYRNGNQFGGRIGGPVIKNKTFFFFLFEGQRFVTKKQFTGPVLTAEARQGLFRFYPGVQNGNAISNNPTVDRAGNPVRPAGATGELTTVNVFGRDPNRSSLDASGWVTRLLFKNAIAQRLHDLRSHDHRQQLRWTERRRSSLASASTRRGHDEWRWTGYESRSIQRSHRSQFQFESQNYFQRHIREELVDERTKRHHQLAGRLQRNGVA